MRPVVVCAPLLVEALALRVRPGGSGLEVRRTGMGPGRSTRSARRLSDRYDAVLVAGLAGALSPRLRPGDVVVATEVRGEEGGRVMCAGAPWLADALDRRGLRVRLGPVVSTARVCRGDERAWLAETGALAVDMESFQLAATSPGRPYAVVRVIVDTPTDPLPRLGTIRRGISSLRTLHAAAPALVEWAEIVTGDDGGDHHDTTSSPIATFAASDAGRAVVGTEPKEGI